MVLPAGFEPAWRKTPVELKSTALDHSAIAAKSRQLDLNQRPQEYYNIYNPTLYQLSYDENNVLVVGLEPTTSA
jgi:hypothetical protein